jgi:hypothetical protein
MVRFYNAMLPEIGIQPNSEFRQHSAPGLHCGTSIAGQSLRGSDHGIARLNVDIAGLASADAIVETDRSGLNQ